MTPVSRKRLSREESKIQTKQLLLDSAYAEFARSGYEKVSVDAIAEQAGYSKGAFYAHFESKESILVELLRQRKRRVLEQLKQILESTNDMEAAITVIKDWVDVLVNDVDSCLFDIELMLYARRNESFALQYESMSKEERQLFEELITKWLKRLGKPVSESPQLVAILMALVKGFSIEPSAIQSAGELFTFTLRKLLD